MLVSSSEGLCRDGLVAAILLRALMIVDVEQNRKSRFSLKRSLGKWKKRVVWVRLQ
jgi:hypothetical protein